MFNEVCLKKLKKVVKKLSETCGLFDASTYRGNIVMCQTDGMFRQLGLIVIDRVPVISV